MSRAILVPVDGSSFAEHALSYGLGIARRTGATLHLALVHVPSDIPTPAHPLAEAVEARAAEDRDRESAYIDQLVERLATSGVPLRPALMRGRVAETLARYADEAGIDLVVMTSHGRGGLQRAWLGSTADALVRQCRRPVLLVRPCDETRSIDPAGAHAFEKVVVALDGSETAERALADGLELGVVLEAAMVLLQVMQPPISSATHYLPDTIQLTRDDLVARQAVHERYLDGIASSDALAGRVVAKRVVQAPDPAQAILEVADELGADLIVMGTHGRGGLRRMILGSVADKVIRGTRRAVLVHRGPGALGRLAGRAGVGDPLRTAEPAG